MGGETVCRASCLRCHCWRRAYHCWLAGRKRCGLLGPGRGNITRRAYRECKRSVNGTTHVCVYADFTYSSRLISMTAVGGRSCNIALPRQHSGAACAHGRGGCDRGCIHTCPISRACKLNHCRDLSRPNKRLFLKANRYTRARCMRMHSPHTHPYIHVAATRCLLAIACACVFVFQPISRSCSCLRGFGRPTSLISLSAPQPCSAYLCLGGSRRGAAPAPAPAPTAPTVPTAAAPIPTVPAPAPVAAGAAGSAGGAAGRR